MSTTAEQVEILLELAAIEPSRDELEQLTATFTGMKSSIERLWSLDLGDTPPSLVFRAAESSGPLGN